MQYTHADQVYDSVGQASLLRSFWHDPPLFCTMLKSQCSQNTHEETVVSISKLPNTYILVFALKTYSSKAFAYSCGISSAIKKISIDSVRVYCIMGKNKVIDSGIPNFDSQPYPHFISAEQ